MMHIQNNTATTEKKKIQHTIWKLMLSLIQCNKAHI